MKHYFGKLADIGGALALDARFAKAFDFLRRPDLAQLKPGRYLLDGERMFANVDELELKPWCDEGVRFEAHRDYIDIQCPLSGEEVIGIAETPAAQVAALAGLAKDCVLWEGKGAKRTLRPGEFAIFFPPTDAHAPGHCEGSSRPHRKVIVKILAR